MSQLHMLSIYTVKSKYWWGEYLTTLAGLCLRLQQPQYATFHVQRGHSFAAIHIKFFHLRTIQQDKAGFKIINLFQGSFPRYRNQTRTQQSSKRLSELVSRFKQNFIFEIFRSPSHTSVLGKVKTRSSTFPSIHRNTNGLVILLSALLLLTEWKLLSFCKRSLTLKISASWNWN